MATGDFSVDVAAIDATLQSIEKVLNIEDMQKQIAELEILASAPDLWDDQARAQQVTSKLSILQADIARIKSLRIRLDDVVVLQELGLDEGDERVTDGGEGCGVVLHLVEVGVGALPLVGDEVVSRTHNRKRQTRLAGNPFATPRAITSA